ncbi:hypothetical protein AM5_030 [Lactococcus phage AM5]|uniref:Uncharacterized protein n=1 Tax=Lactococcus phage AM5 TaxID=1965473 RepID=A0A1W6JKY9_9CAUD|nr:hypothetical protein AM5_030 [Lactococcus phage AM5]
MTKFEEEFKALTSWDWVNVDLIQKILTKFGNWHSDEEFQDMKAIGGSFALANQNLIDDNKKLVKEISDLKSQLQQQALPVVPEDVAEQIERVRNNNGTYTTLGLFDSNYDKKPDYAKWIQDNINKFMIACSVGYTVEEQKFYLRNKLTGMYLYKKPLGGYGEDPTNYIKDLTNDFKFTQKEIDGMDAQGYDKLDEYKGE